MSDYAGRDGFTISFLDLVELAVVARLRAAGVAMRAAGDFRACYAIEGGGHALAAGIFGDRGWRYLGVSADRWGLHVRPFLDQLDYEEGMAVCWRIMPGVSLDGRYNFGAPSTGAGVATRVLAGFCRANGGDVGLTARWHEVPAMDVRAAVRFEAEYGG